MVSENKALFVYPCSNCVEVKATSKIVNSAMN